jgi:hypothetical protein
MTMLSVAWLTDIVGFLCTAVCCSPMMFGLASSAALAQLYISIYSNGLMTRPIESDNVLVS